MRVKSPFLGKGNDIGDTLVWVNISSNDFHAKCVYDVCHYFSTPFEGSCCDSIISPCSFVPFHAVNSFLYFLYGGGSTQIGRSWSAGEGRGDEVDPLSLLSRSAKYWFHSSRSSVSLVGAVPSRFLTLWFDLLFLPESVLMIFQVVLQLPLWSASWSPSNCCCMKANSLQLYDSVQAGVDELAPRLSGMHGEFLQASTSSLLYLFPHLVCEYHPTPSWACHMVCVCQPHSLLLQQLSSRTCHIFLWLMLMYCHSEDLETCLTVQSGISVWYLHLAAFSNQTWASCMVFLWRYEDWWWALR